MDRNNNKQGWLRAGALALALACLLALAGCGGEQQKVEEEPHTATTFAMDTLIDQRAYGATAQQAMQQVNVELAAWEEEFSLFSKTGDVARINAAAGQSGVEVSSRTAGLLQQAVELSPLSEGAFAITIAPLTRAWGITTDTPRVPLQQELDQLLPLVDDSALKIDGQVVTLPVAGMGLDLGGIAKGAACSLAKQVYEEYGLSGAWISIGGNVYVHGTKPGGVLFNIGFRDPARSDGAYIASVKMQDEVIAVSGGYERYFEVDGHRYIHIIDPRTGYPVESDILSVGVINEDGAVADFWSTTLFVWGREKTLEHMRQGNTIIMLDTEGNLYVSESLRDRFTLNDEAADEYQLIFVPKEA